MAAQLLMGVDIGTYSAKGVLTTPEGQVLAQEVVEHGMSIPRPGWAEHDPETTWWGEFITICRTLLDASGVRGEDVAGVAVSAIGPAVLPVDRRGRPLRQAILYGIDTRATREIADLDERYGAETIYMRGGSMLSSQAGGAKIMWLKRNEPDVYRETAYFHSAADFIVLRLTGRHIMDTYTASAYTPLFDIERGDWTDAFAGDIVDLARLPEVRWASEIAGEVTANAAEQTGLTRNTPVTVGTVDVVAEAVSVGAIRPGDLMLMYGTTSFFLLASDRVIRHPAMWSVYHALPGLHAVAAGMATTGALTRWFRDNFARDLIGKDVNAYEALAREAAEAPPGSRGLVVLPYFSGERTPINDPAARGVICGLTLAHDRGHVYRAVLEGTAYGIAHNLEVMREAGGEYRRIVAVGGGTKNPTWLQMVSDVSNALQQVPGQTIGASYGDAFLAGYATGVIPSLDILDATWVRLERTVEPDARTHALYQEYVSAYRRLYRDTRDEQHRLAELSGLQDL